MRRLLALLIPCLLLLLGAVGPDRGDNTLKTSLRSSPQASLRTDLTTAADFGYRGNGRSVFLFIIDDMGRMGVSSYTRPETAWPANKISGKPATETPEFDQLSQVGTMMMMAHDSQSCITTKCDIVTGLGSWRTLCDQNAWPVTTAAKNNIRWLSDQVTGAQGSTSWAFGKTGLLTATMKDNGFTYYRGQPGNIQRNFGHYLVNDIDGVQDPDFYDGTAPEGDDPHATDRLVVDVKAKLDEGVPGSKLWWIHPHDVHFDFHICTMLPDGTCRDEEAQWGSYDDRPWDDSPLTNYEGLGSPTDPRHELWVEALQSMIEHVDYKIGEMVDLVDLTEDYVIVMSEDAAEPAGYTNPFGDGEMVDGQLNYHEGWDAGGKGGFSENYPPMWIAGPGIAAGGRSHFRITHRDLYYTILAMMGIPVPTHDDTGQPIVRSIADGINLLPYLQGGPMPSRRFLQIGYDRDTPTTDLYNLSDQRSEYKMCFESSEDLGCFNHGSGAFADQLMFLPVTTNYAASDGGITSGTIYEYLFELYTTQHLNIENDRQSWCYDGSGSVPAAHVCEDFEGANTSLTGCPSCSCLEDTSADAQLNIEGDECAYTDHVLAGTQSLHTGGSEWLVFKDLSPATSSVAGTGCSDTAICVVDLLVIHDDIGSSSGGRYLDREMIYMSNDNGITGICIADYDDTDGDDTTAGATIRAETEDVTGSGVGVDLFVEETEYKLRLVWDASVSPKTCTVYLDPITGTHGEGAIGSDVATVASPTQPNIDEVWLGARMTYDNVVVFGHEPIPAGRFDNAIEGLGFDIAQNFESNKTCTDLGLTPVSGSSDESFCSVSTGSADGNFSFSAGDSTDTTNDYWAYDATACAGLSGETCELEFDFHVITLSDRSQELFVSLYDAAGTTRAAWLSIEKTGDTPSAGSSIIFYHSLQDAFDPETTGIGGVTPRQDAGHNCGPVDLGVGTTCNVLEGNSYRMRWHLEEDGNADHAQAWLWRLDSSNQIVEYMGGIRVEGSVSNQLTEPAELWFGPNGTLTPAGFEMDITFDNIRLRVIPNAEL